jgi:hypothetical protein
MVHIFQSKVEKIPYFFRNQHYFYLTFINLFLYPFKICHDLYFIVYYSNLLLINVKLDFMKFLDVNLLFFLSFIIKISLIQLSLLS